MSFKWMDSVGMARLTCLSALAFVFLTVRTGAAQNAPRHVSILVAALPSSSGGADSVVAEFKHAMRRLGYVDGKDVVYDVRQRMRGDTAIIDSLVRELIARRPAVVVAFGSTEALKTMTLSPSTPVVAWSSNPVAEGLITSLSQPATSVTGATASPEFWPTLLAMLRRTVPFARRLAIIYDSTYRPQRGNLPVLQRAADSLGLTLRAFHAHLPEELERELDSAAKLGAQSVFLMSPSFRLAPTKWTRSAAARHLIAFSTYDEIVEAGGLFACPPDFQRFADLAATSADRLLRGVRPADMPFAAAVPSVCTLNLRAAEELGIQVPDTVTRLYKRLLR